MTDPVFFAPVRSVSAADIAALTGAVLADQAHGDIQVTRISPSSEGGDGSLVFVEGRQNAANLALLSAAAVLCTADLADRVPAGIAVLTTRGPQRAFAQVGRLLFPEAASPGATTGETGISPRAFVDPTASLEASVIVEAGAVIAAGAALGSGTIVGPNAVVGRDCRIGRDCFIGAGAVVQYTLMGNRVIIHPGAKIGQDGFGFVGGASGPERLPQIGRVIIQDNVEIGANSTVDRGAMADTVIGENTKIDNLVQIGHNVRLGRACLIAGRSGISGSVTVGDNVMMGGGVGLADHLVIGDGARLAAGSGFMTNVPAGEVWAGYPAQPMGQMMREIATVKRLARRKPSAEADNG